jgi:hypothetical protein
VLYKATDFGPPEGCGDSPRAPKASAAIAIASSTSTASTAYMPVIKYDAITDAEYLVELRVSIISVQCST